MESPSSFISTLRERHGFTDVEEIGRGGMGVVYKARDPHLDRYVAVKQLGPELIADEAARARITSEMKTLARVSHSAVVSVHTSGIADDGSAYFIMDYVPGFNLSDLIRERKQQGRALSVEETVGYLQPVALALDHLHLKMSPPIIHRDVKPANILIPSGGGFEARSLLTDFGISLTEDDTRLTSLSVVAGTERYIAPELFPGQSHGSDGTRASKPDSSSDNYALALVALEMLTMRSLKDTMDEQQWTSSDRPFPRLEDMGLSETDASGLKALEEVFRKALDPTPAYRYSTANEFVQALARSGEGWAVDSIPAPGASGRADATTASSIPSAATGSSRVNPFGSGAAPANPFRNGSASPHSAFNQQAPAYQGAQAVQAGPGAPFGAPVAQSAYPTSPAQSVSYPVGARQGRKKGSWGVVAALGAAVVALAGGVGYLAYYVSSHPSWESPEATIAAAFPDAVPSLQNGNGWDGGACSPGTAEAGETARIVCEGENVTSAFIDYGSWEARDEALSGGSDRVGWELKECSVESADLGSGSYSLLPGDPKARFGVLVQGDTAADARLEVPVC